MKFLRFQRTFPRLLSKKGVPKNFPPNTPLYFGEVFEIPKDFLQKVLCVQVWGGQPQLITLSQKKHGNAVLFILSKYVGTAFQTSFSYLSYKKGKPKNFPPTTPLHFGEAFKKVP